MPTTARSKEITGILEYTNVAKSKTAGGIARTSGSIGRCKMLADSDNFIKNNTGKITGGLAGAMLSVPILLKENNCFSKYMEKYVENGKIKKTTTAICGVIGTAILTGLGVLMGGSIDKAIEKARTLKAEKDLAGLEINRNID